VIVLLGAQHIVDVFEFTRLAGDVEFRAGEANTCIAE
jgi:hypothetical protein